MLTDFAYRQYLENDVPKRQSATGMSTDTREAMPHQTLIISDTHLGKPRGATAQALRPIWQGVDELVINGDTAEVQVPWLRGAAVRELDRLEQLARQDGVKLTLISGNHDAYLTDQRCLQLANAHILVMHGDALHPAVAPWTRYAKPLAQRTEREIAKARTDDLASRLDIAQHVGHSEFLREYVLSSLGENALRRILARPLEVPLVLKYWRSEPALAERFLMRYAPQTKVLIVGHSHRRGVWKRGERTIINTGAFTFPGRPQCVLHRGDTLSVHHIVKRDGLYHREAKPVTQIQDPSLFDDASSSPISKPNAA